LEYLETNEQLSISTSKWIDYLITFIRYLNSNQNVNSSIAITASEFSINLKHLYNKLKFRIESYKQEFDFNHELFSKIYNLLSLELEKAKKSSNFFYRNFNRLQKKNLIVSPGDIGLHNSIKSKNSLFFFDFEYGGLDDPHRMILDFFYNPSNEGLREYAIRIKQELVKLGYEINSERLYLTMPFIRIKWILIKFKRDYITNDYRQPNYIEKIENLLNITSDQLL
jgi:thiamine kinase-like enzyme